ncbi:MAG: Bardet-Biedl syndrome 5 protein [Monoraphidium minutum]|nr:MAG: Bardet-Biedl syndrome 5 protein [Monoraphidium minutum]
MEKAPSLAETLFGRRGPDPEVWQDREVRFDLAPADLACRRGEDVLDYMEHVEDTKGNNGEPGELTVTNLRITWVCRRNRRTSISVGLDCITQISVRPAASRLRGDVSALYLLTRHGSQRYEFVFTALDPGAGGPELLAVGVSQAYEASRLYRELKLRGAVVSDGELRLMPSEQAYSKISGVTNLSSDAGALGSFFITNVRLVWYSAAAEGFSISLPYLQMKSVRVSDSKFGPCLVLETTLRAGGYVLGFKAEPQETLDYIHKEISSLWQVYSQAPVFGVQYDASGVRGGEAATAAQQAAAAALASEEEDVRILGEEACPKTDTWAAACYGADGGAGGPGGGCEAREPVYSRDLGLAVEAPRDPGVTVRQLWSVL